MPLSPHSLLRHIAPDMWLATYKQEATDELVGVEGHRPFSISVSSIPAKATVHDMVVCPWVFDASGRAINAV